MSNTESWDLRDKTVVVTGGSAGIGKATVEELAKRGAHVILTSRSLERAERAAAELAGPDAGLKAGSPRGMQLDLGSFRSIRAFAERLLAKEPSVHVLVHNAGLIRGVREETRDGLEMTLGVNHLGPFYLNQLLEGRLRESAPSRVVVVASNAHMRIQNGLDFDDLQCRTSYDAVDVYSRSKLANILFTRELARRLDGSGVTANSLHPGVVASEFNQIGGTGGMWGFAFKWLRPFLMTPSKGARTTMHLCCDPGVGAVSGEYFERSRLELPSEAARDDAAAKRLWDVSEALCAGAGGITLSNAVMGTTP